MINKRKKQKLERVLSTAIAEKNGDRIRNIVGLMKNEASKYGSLGNLYLKNLMKSSNEYVAGAASSTYAIKTGDLSSLLKTKFGGLGWDFSKNPIYGGIKPYSQSNEKKIFVDTNKFKFTKNRPSNIKQANKSSIEENYKEYLEKNSLLNLEWAIESEIEFQLHNKISSEEIYLEHSQEIESMDITIYSGEEIKLDISMMSPIDGFHTLFEKEFYFGPFLNKINHWKPISTEEQEPGLVDTSTILISKLKEKIDQQYSGRYKIFIDGIGSYDQRQIRIIKKIKRKEIGKWAEKESSTNQNHSKVDYLRIKEYTQNVVEDMYSLYQIANKINKPMINCRRRLSEEFKKIERKNKSNLEKKINSIF